MYWNRILRGPIPRMESRLPNINDTNPSSRHPMKHHSVFQYLRALSRIAWALAAVFLLSWSTLAQTKTSSRGGSVSSSEIQSSPGVWYKGFPDYGPSISFTSLERLDSKRVRVTVQVSLVEAYRVDIVNASGQGTTAQALGSGYWTAVVCAPARSKIKAMVYYGGRGQVAVAEIRVP